MRIAIHQPNFLPWYPYFEKIQKVDKFIFLTHCQFEKGGYQNRFNIGEKWYTMSVSQSLEPISKKTYLNPLQDWQRIKDRLPQYRKVLSKLDKCVSSNLRGTNMFLIMEIRDMLNIKTEFSIDQQTEAVGTDRLVEICQANGATTYLAGPSGGKYMDFTKFDRAGITVEFHENKIKRPILEVLDEAL